MTLSILNWRFASQCPLGKVLSIHRIKELCCRRLTWTVVKVSNEANWASKMFCFFLLYFLFFIYDPIKARRMKIKTKCRAPNNQNVHLLLLALGLSTPTRKCEICVAIFYPTFFLLLSLGTCTIHHPRAWLPTGVHQISLGGLAQRYRLRRFIVR